MQLHRSHRSGFLWLIFLNGCAACTVHAFTAWLADSKLVRHIHHGMQGAQRIATNQHGLAETTSVRQVDDQLFLAITDAKGQLDNRAARRRMRTLCDSGSSISAAGRPSTASWKRTHFSPSRLKRRT